MRSLLLLEVWVLFTSGWSSKLFVVLLLRVVYRVLFHVVYLLCCSVSAACYLLLVPPCLTRYFVTLMSYGAFVNVGLGLFVSYCL